MVEWPCKHDAGELLLYRARLMLAVGQGRGRMRIRALRRAEAFRAAWKALQSEQALIWMQNPQSTPCWAPPWVSICPRKTCLNSRVQSLCAFQLLSFEHERQQCSDFVFMVMLHATDLKTLTEQPLCS